MIAAEEKTAVDESWGRVRSRLRSELGNDVYDSWFASLELERVDSTSVSLSTPTRFLRQWITNNYLDTVLSQWRQEVPAIERIHVTERSHLRKGPAALDDRARDTKAPPRNAATVAAPNLDPNLAKAGVAGSAQRVPPAMTDAGFEGSPLDPRFTLEAFEEGRSNQLALAAARQVAYRNPGDKVAFNPLFIHAPVGYGKTHLLHAIAAARAVNPSKTKSLYLTAECFMYKFVAALKAKTTLSFKELLRDIDVLLIDDLQFLNGLRIQEEFFHTLNTLLDGSRQVVVAADRAPVELESLEPRVRSRLGGGLLVEIGAPDLDLRRRMLKRRVELQRVSFPKLAFPEEVIEFVARSVTTNGRDLDGALNRLVAHDQLNSTPITVELAETVLRDLLRAREARRPKIEDIQRAVSQHFGVSKSDLVSARRTRSIVRPRQIAMFLCKMLTPRSLPEIGRRFGGRDHTTVLHAVRKVEELMRDDQQIAEDVETLKRLLDD